MRPRLRNLGPVLGVVLPGGLDRPRHAPLGIGGTIVQVVCQHPRAVADDHLVAQHDRMEGQQPLGRAAVAPHAAIAARPEGRLTIHPDLLELDAPLGRAHIDRARRRPSTA